jgi:DNA-binding MarR family transcriptional regulator
MRSTNAKTKKEALISAALKKKLPVDPLLDPIPLDQLIQRRERFESDTEMFTGVLIYTASHMDYLINETLKSFEITRPQYNLLNILYNNHPAKMSMGLVTMRMVDKTSNVTRLADRLAERGIVQKIQKPDNRRVNELNLTPKGFKLYEKMRDMMRDKVWSLIDDKLTAKQINAATDILIRLKTGK